MAAVANNMARTSLSLFKVAEQEPMAVHCPKADTFNGSAALHSTIEHTMFTLCTRPCAFSVASELRDQQLAKKAQFPYVARKPNDKRLV